MRACGAGDDAAGRVRVAVDPLGGGVERVVRALRQRPLERRGGEGAVHQQRRAGSVGGVGDGREVGHREQRIGHALGEDQLRADHDEPLDGRGVAQLQGEELDLLLVRDALEEGAGGSVAVHRQDDPVAGGEPLRVEDGAERGHPAAEDRGGLGALQRGDGLLEQDRVLAADAGVDEVLAVERGVELVRRVEPAHRRGVDGGGDGDGAALRETAPRVNGVRRRLPGGAHSPCSTRNRSASIAAMQPVPAAVTACRYIASCTSPQAKTPSTLVRVLPGTVLR